MTRPGLTTSRHLVQPPRYQSQDGRWHTEYLGALTAGGDHLEWNVAGLQSLCSFIYPCADHTLIRNVVRQPWISQVTVAGVCKLDEIPDHGLRWMDGGQVADELHRRIREEVLAVCRDRRKIYILLSGGLDSRIIAGALAETYRQGELACKPVGVTWGFEDSRDVVYARETARILDFDWVHIPTRPEDLLDNVEAIAHHLGALIPAMDIHRILWFRDVEPDAIVLAGSYGDSVGRGEFAGRTLLELEAHKVRNFVQLLKPEYASAGRNMLESDFAALRERKPNQYEFVYHEHEQQCYYMRGLYGLGLSLIGRFCDFYQMFTAPSVYGFVWSLHPALRTDEPYSRLLERYDTRLARLPWARTNRALRGQTIGAIRSLRRSYHDYPGWVRGPLYGRLREIVEPKWFEQTGVFDGAAILALDAHLRAETSPTGMQGAAVSRIYLWLAATRRMAELAKANKLTISPPEPLSPSIDTKPPGAPQRVSLIRRWIRANPKLKRWMKQRLTARLRRQSLRLYPPTS